MEHITMSVFDYSGKKQADFYDNQIEAKGQAYDISITYEINGNRKLVFSLPYFIGDVSNWRWKFIKSEYRIRVRIGGKEDWYLITSPKLSKSNKAIESQVTCEHLSSILKTKNLYLYFDDENGIGTAPYLMNQILAGTGWSFDEDNSDVFYENYTTKTTVESVTIKKRSLTSTSKTGAHALIAKVCDQFDAYPIYHAETKTVTLHALENKLPLKEMIIGKNLTALSVTYNSDSIVTRLYVEGNYQDNGDYVGIEDINPTGQPFLLNFDYYKEIGAFTPEHQAALDTYLRRIKEIKTDTSANATILNPLQTKLSILWGQVNYVLWTVTNKRLDKKYIGGTLEEKEQSLDVGDKLYIFTSDRRYTTVTLTAAILNSINAGTYFSTNVTHALKFSVACNGSIGAKEVAIEAKEKVNKRLQEENAKDNTSDSQKARNNDIIAANLKAIEDIYNGGVSESYEFKFKVSGEAHLTHNMVAESSLNRDSTALLSSTTHYIDSGKTAFVRSDASVTTTAANTRLIFGDYGKSAAIPNGLEISQIEDIPLTGISEKILDVNTVMRDVNIKVENTSTNAEVIYLQGTTFTFSIPTLTYGLYEQYYDAVLIAEEIGYRSITQDTYLAAQANIEADFVYAMGDLLRDGYWNNENYIVGQEEFLYNDAKDLMKEISKPSVSYTISLEKFSERMGRPSEDIDVNTQLRIYDPELEINDKVYVKKVTKYLDNQMKGSVEISNEEVQITGNSFDSVFNRITNIADLVEQRRNVFERASALTSNGSLASNRLEGAINLQATRLSSAVSNWYTDDNGNIIFESADGMSSMMLCGQGFMIASGKNADGTWNWRTFGTGEGFTADALITGYLSADRIEANSITANKLAADVGQSLDLSSNKSIVLRVQDIVEGTVGYSFRIVPSNGLFLSDNVQSTDLEAKVFLDNEDITSQFPASKFLWIRNSGDKAADTKWNTAHAGRKAIQVTPADVPLNATIECRITLTTDNQERMYYDLVSITNLSTTAHLVEVYLSSNHPVIQHYDPNLGGKYAPDWREVPLTITPSFFVDGNNVTPATDALLTAIWDKRIGSDEVAIGLHETVNENGRLTVNDNLLAEANGNSVTYICTVIYDGEIRAQETVSFMMVASAEEPMYCSVTGGNIFKKVDGGFAPATQTQTATIRNVTVIEWQYKDANDQYVKINGSDGKSSIDVSPTETIWNGDTCTIKLVTSNPNVYDVFSLYRLADGIDGQPGVSYYTYIRYSKYADGHEMEAEPTSETKYIGIYVGTSPIIPPYGSFKWSKYVGNDGDPGANGQNGVGIQSITEYYMASSKSAGVKITDSGWQTTVQTTSKEKRYLWNYEKIEYTSGVPFTSDPLLIGMYSEDGKDGSNGETTYFHVKYSDDGGTTFTSDNGETPGDYMGTYVDFVQADSTDVSRYQWKLIKGSDGRDGLDGERGSDGTSVTILGSYDTQEQLQAEHTTGSTGDAYIIGGDLYVWATSAWKNVGKIQGPAGRGIASVTITYQVGSSGTTAPTGTWLNTIPSVDPGKYLWTRTYTTYTDGESPSTTYSVARTGTNGQNGVGVESIANHYAASNSYQSPPSVWYDEVQKMTTANRFLWNYETITYTNGNSTDTSPRVIGVYGEKGKDGVGITSITNKYLVNNDNSQIPSTSSGTWSDTPINPTSANKYLWNYETITYSNGNTKDTTPALIGTFSDDGVGIKSTAEYYCITATNAAPAFNESNPTSGEWTTDVLEPTSEMPFLWNAEIIVYTDDHTNVAPPHIISIRGTDGTSVTISATETKYATTATNQRPNETSTLWKTTAPTTISRKTYLWTWVRVTYSDGTVTNSYSVAYSGSDGENVATAFLTNEAVVINAGYDGKVAHTVITTNVVGYNGTTKVMPVVKQSGITGAVEGMSILSAADSSSTNEMKITVDIAEGSTMGSTQSISGQINIPVIISVSGKEQLSTTQVLSWSKVNAGKDGLNGASIWTTTTAPTTPNYTFTISELSGHAGATPKAGDLIMYSSYRYTIASVSATTVQAGTRVSLKGDAGANATILTLYAPNGNVFLNGVGTLTIKATAFSGSTNITESSASVYKWEKFVDGSWYSLGATASSISISGSDVNGVGIYRCTLTYNGTPYTDVITLTDKTDNYQAVIRSSGGNVFYGNTGTSELTCLLYQNGTQVDPSDITYAWTELDKYGTKTAFSKSGKTITITASEVDEKSTFICTTVGNTIGQFTITKETNIVTSSSQPTNPEIDSLWLDTSSTPAVLKRWVGEMTDASGETVDAHWEEVTVSQDQLNDLDKRITQTTTTLETLDGKISGKVEASVYEEEVNKLTTMISQATLDDEKFTLIFGRTVSNGINQKISDNAKELSDYKSSVSHYLNYSSDGVLTLGSTGTDTNNFRTQITNRKMSFVQGNNEVAYISDSSMYITQARITNTLSIGTEEDGYFDWVVTPTGLGLKWRDATKN